MNPPGTRSIAMEKFRQTILNLDGGHGARAGRDHNFLPAGEVASKTDSAIGPVKFVTPCSNPSLHCTTTGPPGCYRDGHPPTTLPCPEGLWPGSSLANAR
jgi:hypothetical protein